MNETAQNKLKIVVVDDSDYSRKGIVETLEAEGHEIVGEANNAEAALQLTASTACELLIVDIVMPKVSGIDLAKLIREKFPEKYVVMISSLVAENIVIEAISNGAVDFLQKPFGKNELLRSVEKIQNEINSKEKK